jgi:hypothetical protein
MSTTKQETTTVGLVAPTQTGGALMYKPSVDKGTGTDFSRKLLAPRDWFYSNLFRELLERFCDKGKCPVDGVVQKYWREHDIEYCYRDINEIDPNNKKSK